MSIRLASAAVAALTLAACSGGSPAVHLPPHATKTLPVQLSIVIPLPRQSSAARHATFVSPGTQSGGIALGPSAGNISQSFDLSASAPACTMSGSARTCRVSVDLPIGSDTITLTTFDGPLSGGRPSGHQLATSTVTQTIAEGQLNTVVMSLLGIPAVVTIVPQPSTISATGTQVTVPLAVTVYDASGSPITGPDKYSQPIAFTAQAVKPPGAQIGFAVNGTSCSVLTSPVDTISLVYGGSGGTGDYTINATINFGNTRVGSAPFTIKPGFTLVQQLFAGSMTNADLVQAYNTRDIWVTEPAAHKLAAISASGSFAEYPVTSGKEPRHIVYTAVTGVFPGAGRPYVITEFPDTIGFVATNGSITETTVPTPNAGVGGLFYDAGRFTLWFAEAAGKIGTSDLSGHVTEYPTGIAGSTPAYVAQNFLSGGIWFTDPGTNSIGLMRPDHTFVEYPIPTANASPSVIVGITTNDTWFAEGNAAKLGHIDNSSGAIVEYPAPDVIVSLVGALSDGSNAAVWALTRGGTVLKYDASGAFQAYPVTLVGNGTPAVLTQGYRGDDLLILRNGVSVTDLDRMFY